MPKSLSLRCAAIDCTVFAIIIGMSAHKFDSQSMTISLLLAFQATANITIPSIPSYHH
jgi:hypothetical protein